jgi:hypothetical protein
VIDEETALAVEQFSASGYRRFPSAKPGETVAEHRERLRERQRRGIETRQRNVRKRKEREKKERERAIRRKKKRVQRKLAQERGELPEIVEKEPKEPAHVDLVEVILWVFEHLYEPDRRIDWSTAPCKGAWGFWKHAKTEPKDFYNRHVIKALAIQEGREREARDKAVEKQSEAEPEKVVDKSLPEVKRLLRELRKRAKKEVQEGDAT